MRSTLARGSSRKLLAIGTASSPSSRLKARLCSLRTRGPAGRGQFEAFELKRLRNATDVHRKLYEAEDKKQEQARAERAETATRIRAAFQKTVSRERGNEWER